jgi:hypothetical protein
MLSCGGGLPGLERINIRSNKRGRNSGKGREGQSIFPSSYFVTTLKKEVRFDRRANVPQRGPPYEKNVSVRFAAHVTILLISHIHSRFCPSSVVILASSQEAKKQAERDKSSRREEVNNGKEKIITQHKRE